MSDRNKLEIVLKMIQQGDFKGAEAEIKKVTSATKDDSKATEQASVSKKDFLANLKALKHEIPGLGTAITLIKNPLVALGATIGIGISMWRNWTASVREASIAAYDLAHAQNAMSKAEIIIAVAQATKQHAEALKEIKTNASSAATALNEETEAFLANQRAAEKLTDAETTLKIAQIKASDKSDAAKILAIEEVTAQARHRKEQAEVDAAEKAAEAEAKRIGIARDALAKAQQQLPADEAIKEQTRLAGHYAGQNTVLLPQLEQDKTKRIKELEELMTQRAGIVGRIRTGNIGGFESVPTLRQIRLPEKDREINAKEKEITLIDKQVEASKALAAETKQRLDDMIDARKKFSKAIEDQTATIENSTRKLKGLMENWENLRNTNTKASGFLDAAGSINAGREAKEADQRDRERIEREREHTERELLRNMKKGRRSTGILDLDIDTSDPRGGSGALNVPINSAPMVAAADQLGQATQSGFEAVSDALKEHARHITLMEAQIRHNAHML